MSSVDNIAVREAKEETLCFVFVRSLATTTKVADNDTGEISDCSEGLLHLLRGDDTEAPQFTLLRSFHRTGKQATQALLAL